MGLLDVGKDDLAGLESIFDAENLLGVDTEMNMLDDMSDEFLQGMETPLTSMAVFDDAPIFEPRQDKRIEMETNSLDDSDSALKMISYLKAQLREKENEIQRLKLQAGEPEEFSLTNTGDDFDSIVEEAVNAVDTTDSTWLSTSDSVIEPILSKDDDLSSTPLDGAGTLSCGNTTAPSSPSDSSFEESATKPCLKTHAPLAPVNTSAVKSESPAPCTPATTSSAPSATKLSPSSSNKRRIDALNLATQENKKARTTSQPKSFLGRKIKSEPVASSTTSESDPSKPKKIARRWTAEQDEDLRRAVAKHNGQNWKAIAKMVPDRDHVQCLQRWKKVLQPGLVKGMWSKEEDDLLLQVMSSSQPKNWADIAAKVPGRTAKQCRERWSLNLDPSINRESWTQEEDELLLKLHTKLGNRWAEIKQHLNGRTENGVKTRFKSIERARAKDKEVVWTSELEAQLHEICVRFDCRIDEVAKHLPRALRGISAQAMRDHCPLLREAEAKRKNKATVCP